MAFDFSLQTYDDDSFSLGLANFSRSVATVHAAGQLNPRQLNGRFFVAFHDDARNEQVVITDRLGSMHGYYALRDGRVAAKELVALSSNHAARN